ncbi:DNA-binding transcriptional regulator YhcF, GntR family [Amycolatopsis arida]|uniref:DNA-binding transcriptional regulator YhcF, GntR family n=1 Tax=Amycolatopsis arida TaxID=587909 RepID=A0A1I5WJB6_9PSEU|nr:GntR family transcriptional regulator [Amycolatopsis arida]TDX92318.1 DNA-binding transcriptional regulator YhcF (GntR family) [Amycolatopsis arida]SFQ19922.1 DNA-binding transcriptional regulator YhcF, GntR family [Amycolatopsis arida]
MIVEVDSGSPVPPFEQVRAGLARQINDGALPVGTKLPTVRQLAADLGIAPNTIARAYRELEEAGLIETRGRAGSFVGAGGDESRRRAQLAAADYAATVRRLGLSRDEALAIVTAALDGTTPGRHRGQR